MKKERSCEQSPEELHGLVAGARPRREVRKNDVSSSRAARKLMVRFCCPTMSRIASSRVSFARRLRGPVTSCRKWPRGSAAIACSNSSSSRASPGRVAVQRKLHGLLARVPPPPTGSPSSCRSWQHVEFYLRV
jgi:hypothetical protein